MIRRGRCRVALAIAALVAGAVPAVAADPIVPAGVDPGGLAVAFVGGGVDVAAPDIARRLARDGEGVPIARDLVDGDAVPHATMPAASGASDSGTILRRIAASAAVRAIVVRVDPDDLAQLARAIAFVASTPARVVVLPVTGLAGPKGELVRQAAARFRGLLLVAGLPEEDGTTRAAAGPPPVAVSNLLLVSSAVDAKAEPALAEVLVDVPADLARAPPPVRLQAALAGTIQRLACLAAESPAARGSDLKTLLVAAGDQTRATGGRRGVAAECPRR